jgi:hypothetical protein
MNGVDLDFVKRGYSVKRKECNEQKCSKRTTGVKNGSKKIRGEGVKRLSWGMSANGTHSPIHVADRQVAFRMLPKGQGWTYIISALASWNILRSDCIRTWNRQVCKAVTWTPNQRMQARVSCWRLRLVIQGLPADRDELTKQNREVGLVDEIARTSSLLRMVDAYVLYSQS